jgi:PAS fold
VAVTVERTPDLVLDADYRVLVVSPAAEADFACHAGRSLWEIEPAARPVFEPHFETAWHGGRPVEFVEFYGGRLARVEARVRDHRLEVSWDVLHIVDLTTLDALWDSLHEALEVIETHESGSAQAEVSRARLYAVK